ncbi:hypothetical protein [Neoroseomonas lacus]|uniref:ABC transporter substrate-binding protein n=1 Tax=Neoroseomonas lacus TaxID=287609 RepID=A0A917K550_9PROT|nr:hypothetical protein [Neoroseomonas lacus]GGI98487.1 hypothetical protein GCM10011320_01550 [Neoroseomonas lacus]
MMLKRRAPLLLAALATGWIAAGAAAPAMAQDLGAAIVPTNPDPHSFGDPMASGRPALAATVPRADANQGPRGFGDPTSSGRVATG